MLSSALVPRSQRKYPARSAALALYPAAPLSAAVTFVFFAICLTTRLFFPPLSKGMNLMRLEPCPHLPVESFFLLLKQL